MMRVIIFFFPFFMLVSACNHDEKIVAPTVDNEGLTTVLLLTTNLNAPFKKDTAIWEQLLDINGNPLDLDTSKIQLNLEEGSRYSAKLILLDKTQFPVFDVSLEIKERSNYHLFFYQPLPSKLPFVIPFTQGDQMPTPIPTNLTTTAVVAENSLNLEINIIDKDNNLPGLPLGLNTEFITGTPGNGWLRLQLRHQPNGKDGSYTPGSTDLDIGFKIHIQ